MPADVSCVEQIAVGNIPQLQATTAAVGPLGAATTYDKIAGLIRKPLQARSKLCLLAGTLFGLAIVVAVAVAAQHLDHWFTHHPEHSTNEVEDEPWVITPALWNDQCCSFAKHFKSVDWQDFNVQQQFIANVLAAERGFFAAPNVSFDAESGMTFDGIAINETTGEPMPSEIRPTSAASKEAIHLSLLALALQEPEEAGSLLGPLLPLVYSKEEAFDLLEKKATSLEHFDSRYPGFGGFLPWFCGRGAKEDKSCRRLQDPAGPMEPSFDWQDSVPALDNGQLAWAIVALVRVLEDHAARDGESSRAAALLQRWSHRLARMRASAVNLFYNGQGSGTVRSIANLHNRSVDAATGPQNAWSDANYVLNDAYEGEMMVLFVDLLGNWTNYSSDGAEEKALIWSDKEAHVFPVQANLQGANMTVQQGFWFSSHEQWKTLQLPYLDLPLVKRIFTNGEVARLAYSLDHDLPGLFASVNPPPGVNCPGNYCSAVGVEEYAAQQVDDAAATPYGAFPAILVEPAAGLAWYNHMLLQPRMQSMAGSLEAFALNGSAVASLLTWDAKATSVLAMLGGTGAIVRSQLDRMNLTATFEQRVGGMYASVFQQAVMSELGSNESLSELNSNATQLPMPPSAAIAMQDNPESRYPSCGCGEIPQRRLRRARGKRGET
eukprot:gb/GFBE01009595.1/.p1 GENE.gb/GFBE01009595.1/~~gb/GFBE01009595.1/.p1  ORF type:complete len:663 (+),score=130.69 gb/GFBE01009595.1/:2-1990(+)